MRQELQPKMGTSYYIVVKSSNPSFDTFVNGKALSRVSAKLRNEAKELGVKPLDDFMGMSMKDAAESFGTDEDAAEGLQEEQWFDADSGLESVRALSATVAGQLGKFGEDVSRELDEFDRVLKAAKRENLMWHLAIDY